MRGDPSGLSSDDGDDYCPDDTFHDSVTMKPFLSAVHKGANMGTKVLQVAASSNPISNAGTAITGKDAVTNEKVGFWGRVGAGICAVLPFMHLGEAGEVAGTAAKLGKVKEFEIGTYAEMKVRGIDGGLELHHFPQAHVAKQVISGYTHADGTAIALSKDAHTSLPAISRSRGNYANISRAGMRVLIELQLHDMR